MTHGIIPENDLSKPLPISNLINPMSTAINSYM